MNIRDMYTEICNIDTDDLSLRKKGEIRKFLESTKPEDLCDIDEHRMYVEVVKHFRMANARDLELQGKGLKFLLKSILAIGEDGIYSNSDRFIYELIQNVDDCEYEDDRDCHLDICFKYDTSPGKIILTYNEKGFKPENVFAITGIAERFKNISSDKIEIGEKGVGFKSVFGIAEKVYIESGMFSFELYKDDFTVPIPKYDDFKPVDGTRMTLEMTADNVKRVYYNLVKQYSDKEAVLNKNPFLFLNKLTHLKMYFDVWRYIEFDMERKTPQYIDDIAFEDKVNISVKMSDVNQGIENSYRTDFWCSRYTQSVIYGETECLSRYGNEVAFKERRHNLIALFPELPDKTGKIRGSLYSFLPTEIQTTVPVIIHAPFKLNSSREYVDSQGENRWFEFTTEKLSIFLKRIYIHFATIIKQNIIHYIPAKDAYFFKSTNQKIQCLLSDNLSGNIICEENVFYTTDGDFENASNVVSIDKCDKLGDINNVLSCLEQNDNYFIPDTDINMRKYGVKVISNIPKLLFQKGLRSEGSFEQIIGIVNQIEAEKNYSEWISEISPITLTKSQLMIIKNYEEIHKAFAEYFQKCLSDHKMPDIVFDDQLISCTEDFRNLIIEALRSTELNSGYEKYLNKIGYNFVLLEGVDSNFAIAGKNAVVLSEKAPEGSFCYLTEKYDSRKILVSSLRIKQEENKIEYMQYDESISNEKFLKLLSESRQSIKTIYGKKKYQNYIDIINKSGTDKNRFLNELLQNADDCTYPDNVIPSFSLKYDKDEHIVTVSYNEIGFTKGNISAITSIGESTKKILSDEKDRFIGEKGVGFKSVFGIARSVEIHSNGFDIILMDKSPTIPRKCESYSNSGTILKLDMKSDISSILTEENIFKLCLCLRKLKKIKINEIEVDIDDSDDNRVLTIGKKKYCFKKYIYNFAITDPDAVKERNNNYRSISENQCIYCYLPQNNDSERYVLYSGLPTDILCNLPIVIDAPFELNTSRSSVIKNSRWNGLVKEYVYEALISIMEEKCQELRIDIFKYYPVLNAFSEPYFNANLAGKIRKKCIIPILGSENFVSVAHNKCFIVPEIIELISRKTDISDLYDGIIIDTSMKRQYDKKLKSISCIKIPIKYVFWGIERALSYNMMKDELFRVELYRYFSTPEIQQEITDQGLHEQIKKLPIFPIRTTDGIDYVEYSDKIYIHDDKKSDEDLLILETSIMSNEIFQKIFNHKETINKLTETEYEGVYQNKVKQCIESNRSNKEKAEFLLGEFINNRERFEKCKFNLKGMIEIIPMKMIDGEYYAGNKFVNESNLEFSGCLIKTFVVSDEFKELAEFLGCGDINYIHYNDIENDIELDSPSDDDIIDIKALHYHKEILEGFIEHGIMATYQIEKFHLEYLVKNNDDYDDGEIFPGKEVSNLNKVKEKIRKEFQIHPNPYVKVVKTEYEPQNPVNYKGYTRSVYGSETEPNKCFCQMCGKKFPDKYIERNNIQRYPDYAWEQTYLSLCVTCSKDFESYRDNNEIRKEFIDKVRNVSIGNEDIVEVPVYNKATIKFTAKHLAEIQTILEIEENL